MGDGIWTWRHPRAVGAEGLCIGITDLPVDPRKARRLAYRIRQTARRHGLPQVVATSTLRRTADVGRWLRRWGWCHEQHEALGEMGFGRWDGLPWTEIPRDEIDAWCADFLRGRPGGGEALDALFDRVAAWPASGPRIIVTHAGWMLARQWIATGRPPPDDAARWPATPAHGSCWRFTDMNNP